jgi:UDP-N-acetylglucosamine 1-carboxyvinyltransferase
MKPHPPKPLFVICGLAGEKKLKGTVKINGAKNAALKAMAAAILFDGPVTLENVPDNADVTTMTALLL